MCKHYMGPCIALSDRKAEVPYISHDRGYNQEEVIAWDSLVTGSHTSFSEIAVFHSMNGLIRD